MPNSLKTKPIGEIRTIKICILSSIPVTLRSFYSLLIKELKKLNYRVTLVSSQSQNLNQLGEELGCDTFMVDIKRQISPIQDILAIYKLFRFLRKHKIEMIHAHTPKGGLIGMISSWLAGVPVRVYTIHGLVMDTSSGFKRHILWLAEWVSCKFAKHCLAVSPSLRRRVIDEGICSSNKIGVLCAGSACGIDIAKYTRNKDFALLRAKFRDDYNINNDAVVIGYVGRIVPDKGISTLVDAFEKVQQKKRSDCFLLLVGDIDNVRDRLDDEILSRIKSNPKIIFDNKFVNDVIPFYASMDILTLPSRREGFGLTVIEAGALELPVIASRITGCKDAVVDGQTGLLFDADNTEQLTDSMLELVDNPGLRRKFGRNGRERVMRLFDSKILIDEHIKFYEMLYRGHSI